MLSPGERYRAEAINVLPPRNAEGGSKKNAVTRAKVIGEILLLELKLQQNTATGKIL